MSIEPYAGGSEVARWAAVLVPASQLAERIAGTDFVPKAMRDNPGAVTAAIMYGDEIGIGPMQALAGIHVVEGRPSPSAELMRAMINRAGHTLTIHEMSGQRARASALRAGRPEAERVTLEWNLDMARAAGLTARTVWQRYPRAMLLARVTSDLARLVFPDVIKGMGYIAERPEDAEEVERWGAEVVPVAPDAETIRAAPQRAARHEPVPISPPTPPKVPRQRRPPRVPSPPKGPPVLATEDHPAEDGSVDVPLPLDEPEPDPVEHVAQVIPMPDPRPEEIPPPEDDDGPPPGARPLGDGMRRALFAQLGNLSAMANRETRLAICGAIIGHPITSSNELTRAEGMQILDYLARTESGAVGWVIDAESGRVALHEYRHE